MKKLKQAAVGIVLAGSVVTAWGVLGLPRPATTEALAANTTKDAKFRLTYYTERRDQLYERRASYQLKQRPIPTWLRRSISSVCTQISSKKKALNIVPARCDD